MMKKCYILSLLLCVGTGQALAQEKTDRDYLRSGNKLYNDSLFIKAEVDYRKALELNPKSTDAMFNLGNALLMQQKAKEAMEQYESVSKIEKDKEKLAQIYHNMGVILQSSKQLPQCIEAYKESLRNNPKDDETRYNLALAQKQLKDQQQNQQNQDQQQHALSRCLMDLPASHPCENPQKEPATMAIDIPIITSLLCLDPPCKNLKYLV